MKLCEMLPLVTLLGTNHLEKLLLAFIAFQEQRYEFLFTIKKEEKYNMQRFTIWYRAFFPFFCNKLILCDTIFHDTKLNNIQRIIIFYDVFFALLVQKCFLKNS